MALTDTQIKTIKPSGKPAGDKYSDGGGMFLHVKAAGKYWRMDYTRIHGKRSTLALGVYPAVSLAQARKARDAAKALLAQGIDPSTAKRATKAAKAAEAGNTFEAVALAWLKVTEAKRSAGTSARARAWLTGDVFPSLGALPMSAIGPREVLACLRKIEARGVVDTARRVCQTIGQVFRYAVAAGLADRDVTQDLRGALTVATTQHHAAITEPLALGALLRAMHGYEGHPCTVVALKLSPLLLVRPGELRQAEWAEVDLDTATWAIPAAKMKMRHDHTVPLPRQAVEALRQLQLLTGQGRYVFSSLRTGDRPMSENTVNAALRGMGYTKEVQTAHGFRATARTILDEVLGQRVDLIEHQLAHAVRDANGRAYNRTAHLPARVAMMQTWADYLDELRTRGKVIPLHKAA
ncbi:MAG: integrase arm-type DNA-binding domain-containing protein [Burkholderiaceae bacterium]|nr:integrase arm-type DNA-binding domain-containing protein [Burkholderiaceae bacterium]